MRWSKGRPRVDWPEGKIPSGYTPPVLPDSYIGANEQLVSESGRVICGDEETDKDSQFIPDFNDHFNIVTYEEKGHIMELSHPMFYYMMTIFCFC